MDKAFIILKVSIESEPVDYLGQPQDELHDLTNSPEFCYYVALSLI